MSDSRRSGRRTSSRCCASTSSPSVRRSPGCATCSSRPHDRGHTSSASLTGPASSCSRRRAERRALAATRGPASASSWRAGRLGARLLRAATSAPPRSHPRPPSASPPRFRSRTSWRSPSLAYHTLPIPPSLGDALLDPVSDVVDWLAVLLIAEIEALLALRPPSGLRRRPGRASLRTGQTAVRRRRRSRDATARSRPASSPTSCWTSPRTACCARALELLATQRLLPGLRARVEQLLAGFQRVALRPPIRRAAPVLADHPTQPPLPAGARALPPPASTKWASSLDVGAVAAPAYFFPMETVFQEAVTTLLRQRLPEVSRQRGRTHTSPSQAHQRAPSRSPPTS